MKAGQMLKIECPGYLAYGGQAKYGHFGHDLIPANSALIFELDVLECEDSVEKINAANKKAGNKAPVVRYYGEEEREKPALKKGALKEVKNKVKDLRKNVVKQKKKIDQEKKKEQETESAIKDADDEDQTDNAEKMMVKQEKILKEEKIVKEERKQIKKTKALIKSVEEPKKAEAHEHNGKAVKAKKKEALKEAQKTIADDQGKPFTPNPAPFDCFFIMYPKKDSKGQDLVLEIDHKDKYAPKKTGIYNVRFHPFEGDMDEDDEDNHVAAQQWKYDEKEHKLITKAYPGKVLFQGNNRNLVVYDNKGMKNQYFNYDAEHGIWYNEYTDEGVMVDPNEEIEVGANVITGKRNVTKNFERMHWKMVPCG